MIGTSFLTFPSSSSSRCNCFIAVDAKLCNTAVLQDDLSGDLASTTWAKGYAKLNIIFEIKFNYKILLQIQNTY